MEVSGCGRWHVTRERERREVRDDKRVDRGKWAISWTFVKIAFDSKKFKYPCVGGIMEVQQTPSFLYYFY